MSASVRAMLTRVAKLESARINPLSPIERTYGSFGEFESMVRDGMDAGTYDPRDMPHVLNGLRRMHDDKVWGARRQQAWRDPVWGTG